jgi:hypothetical protein
MSTVTASNKDLSSTLSDMFSSKPSTPSSNTYEPGAYLNSSTGNTDTGFFSSMSWQTWLIIILVLALLGFNVFIYLAKGTGVVAEFINKYFGPLLKLFGISVLETTKQTVNVSATGTKAGVDVVANTTTGVINAVESIGGQQMPSSQQAPSSQKNSMPVQTQDDSSVHQNTLDNSLNHSSQSSEPRPDDSASSYGKAGWCYIGEDNNTRTCAEVGVNDRCMSGDIFPSQQICMNPNLRT